QPGTFGSPISGNGTATSSVGLMFAQAPQTSSDTILSMDRLFSATMNGTLVAYPRMAVPGNVVITWTMDTTDHLFVNNSEPVYYNPPGASAGVQTTGNFQIGGITGNHFGQNPSFLQGKIYYVAIYNRVLTSAEIAANVQYINNAMSARNIVPSLTAPNISPANTNQVVVVDGDSITEGAGFGVATPYPGLLTLSEPATNNISNMGVQGLTMAQLRTGASLAVDPFYQVATQATVVVWGGTNDIAINGRTGIQIISDLSTYCKARRAIGWKCIPVTMVSRTGFDTGKNSYNTLIRQNWSEFADGLADVAADPSLGADGASTNTLYIQAGGVHPTQNSHYNEITPIIQRAINRLYGNLDFSSATVYASAALAATSTTALTESGSTVTVTFAATPANCQVGNQIVIAGVTPSGYNSTSTNGAGNGAWTILTRSATQVTYNNPTTGLGTASVQGTGVCAQQQDIDQFSVLNFGTGNFTLQSSVGLTGQNIWIKNINGTASTIVPYGSETIDGVANLTIASNAVVCLQSVLVSASAAGSNWKTCK
ncbi:MAG TPA: SGNH/GDSL hydrolase family protein, partial [Bacteroidia bacterium]|nr:SGNH/GDSL hydrolase family protein [Bacteroidia bacterium]